MSSITPKGMFDVLKHSAKMFMKDKVPKLSASLAFYTIFSLGPMLLVIIFFANLFWSQSAVENKLVEQVRDLIGETAADQTQKVISNTSISKGNTITSVVSIAALIIGATTVFKEIRILLTISGTLD